jgi:hypothetical protein
MVTPARKHQQLVEISQHLVGSPALANNASFLSTLDSALCRILV